MDILEQRWTGLYRAGAIAAFALTAYCIATIVQLLVLGGQPGTAAEAFRLLQANKLAGLLRLDLPTVLAMPLYYLLFLGFFAALMRAGFAQAVLATALAFAGVTLVIATPTALSMLWLSDRHAAASTPAARATIEAAGEAILASDIWHGTGAVVGGILLQTAALFVSILMLKSDVFGRATACIGILTHGLDLAHLVLGLFLPAAGVVLMAAAGPLYIPWFLLVGRALFRAAALEAGQNASAAKL